MAKATTNQEKRSDALDRTIAQIEKSFGKGSIMQLADQPTLIKDGNYNETILNQVEMAIRAYDPCLSCATHNLDGSIPVKLDLLDHKGRLIKTFKN